MTIIKKKGRVAYDDSVPRIAMEGHRDTRPIGKYTSNQSKINSGPDGTIDQEKLNEIIDNYTIVDYEKLYSLIPGCRISYITKDNKWRSGGFLISVKESPNKEEYILYRGFNGAVFSLQIKDTKNIYVKKTKMVIIKKKITFKKPTKVTKYPVSVKDENGEDVVIYYARDTCNKNKFLASMKYKKALEDPECWEFKESEKLGSDNEEEITKELKEKLRKELKEELEEEIKEELEEELNEVVLEFKKINKKNKE